MGNITESILGDQIPNNSHHSTEWSTKSANIWHVNTSIMHCL